MEKIFSRNFHRQGTRLRNLLWLLPVLWLAPASVHSQPPHPWTTPGADGRPDVHLWFFWSARCPHCLEARPSVLEMASTHPWIVLHDHELTGHPENVELYDAMARSIGQEARWVPAFIYCGRMEAGWESASGAALLAALEECRRPKGTPALSPNLPRLDADRNQAHPQKEPTTMPEGLWPPWIGEFDPNSLSLPVLTVWIAGMDAFNPCAFFVLLFLLSLLVHQQNRGRMLMIGGVFVIFSGVMYFVFMAAWLSLFRIMGSLPWVTLSAGGLALFIGLVSIKDFFAFKKGLSLSIPESRKFELFQRGRRILSAESLPAMLAATIVLAIAANFYELLCTAGFPMVYTRLLTLQAKDPILHYLYLALYNLVYVLPLLLILLAFVRTMGARKLTEREGRMMKLFSGLMMLGLGFLLIFAPDRLQSLPVAFGLIAFAAIATYLAARLTKAQHSI